MKVVIVILCGLLLGTFASQPYFWSPEAVAKCHKEREEYILLRSFWNGDSYTTANEIIPGLWVGSICAASDEQFLQTNNIGLVVSMAQEWPISGHMSGVNFIHVPGLGDSNDEDQELVRSSFETASSLITEYMKRTSSEKSVLIYCNMGISRSVSAAIYHLMATRTGSFDDYLKLVQSKRQVARPNSLYAMILSEYERKEL
jgi:protein-tyrosine phosphatase